MKNTEAPEYYFKGTEEYKKQSYKEAIGYFELSNKLEEHFKTYERLYHCYRELDNMEKALECIQKAYTTNPNNDKTAFEYAEMLAGEGERKLAEDILSEILQRNADYKKAALLLKDLQQDK